MFGAFNLNNRIVGFVLYPHRTQRGFDATRSARMTISTESTAASTTSGLTSEQLAAATAALNAERAAILDTVASRHGDSPTKPDVTDGPGETEHLSVAEYQEVVSRLDAISHRALAAIDASLARIADGTYGSCAACAQPIPFERLEALPSAVYCTPCQATNERG